MSGVNIPKFLLGPLAQLIDGQLVGDPKLELKGFNPSPEKANSEEICFVFTPKYLKKLNEGELNAGAYIVPADSKIEVDVTYIAVKRPKLVVKQLLDMYAPRRYSNPVGIHPTAVIDETTEIADNVKIGPQVVIGPRTKIKAGTEIQAGVTIGEDVQIGAKSLIRSRVVIEDQTIIGDRVIIHPGAVIGADGYSYITKEETIFEMMSTSQSTSPEELFDEKKHANNPHLKVIAAGNVVIGDDVEIGSNTCIDRGTMGPTRVGRGTKIDNLVQIAHNCVIGEDCLIVAQVGLAGSVKLEDRVVVAGQAGCKDGITLGHDTLLLAASHASRDLPPFSGVMGSPAIPIKEFINKEKNIRRVLRDVPKIKDKLAETQSD